MRYRSTRGERGATFEQALSRGYAPDGGLYVPEELPKISLDVLRTWRKLDFPSLALELMKLFAGDELTEAELAEVVRGSYANFSHPEIVPVVALQRRGAADAESQVFIAELFHGPTFCFKDLGQQLLVRLLAHFSKRRNQRRTFLVSTTGDTGPAAMRAVSDAACANLQIIVFFPDGQISELQRRQMTTVSGVGAKVVTFEGGGDDMDLPIKKLSSDAAFAERHGLCGINSYNLGRPLAQLCHFFWSYFRSLDQLQAEVGRCLDFCLPAGALGNTAAAFMARQMGLPIRQIVAGVNANDITHRTITKGEFHRSEHMEKTLSDAINIQVPYNMERVLFYLTGEDSSLIKSWMAEMDATGRLTLPAALLRRMQDAFGSARIDDDAMCACIRRSVEEYGYLLCPHSAVALAAHFATSELDDSARAARVVFATASPCKFEHSVTAALGRDAWKCYQEGPEFPAAARAVLAAQESLPTRFEAEESLAQTQTSWESQLRLLLET